MNRPPPDITPARFFEQWLPAQVAPDAGSPATLTVRVRLDGEGGGVWDLAVGPGGLTVAPGAAADADVTVVQTVQDWKAIAIGEAGAVNLAPPQSSPADVLFLERGARELVRNLRGAVRFEVTGYHGRTWNLTVRFGPGSVDGADATISVDAETYAAMLARALPPAQAYFNGKIRISGDANLAMQLGMALLPRFS